MRRQAIIKWHQDGKEEGDQTKKVIIIQKYQGGFTMNTTSNPVAKSLRLGLCTLLLGATSFFAPVGNAFAVSIMGETDSFTTYTYKKHAECGGPTAVAVQQLTPVCEIGIRQNSIQMARINW
jgi:hypothetical protein